MNPAKKVLFVITGLEYGGAEIQLLQLCKGLMDRGWETPVVSMIKPGPVGAMLRDAGVTVSSLEMKRRSLSIAPPFELARKVRVERPALVHSHLVHANLFSRVASVLFPGTPVVNSGHNVAEGSIWLYRGYRWTDALCDRFHTISKVALQGYIEGGYATAEKLMYLPNGIAFDASPVPEGSVARLRAELGLGTDFVYLNPARLSPQKNQAGLLSAFAKLEGDVQLLIAGEGPLLDSLLKLRSRLGLQDRVHFLGPRDDMDVLMEASDAMVLSSSWEGMPLVILEAAAARLPVVATAVGDVPLIIEHEKSGLLVDQDNVAALAAQMRSLITRGSENRARLANELHDGVLENYGMPEVVDRWERVYAEVVRRNGRPRE